MKKEGTRVAYVLSVGYLAEGRKIHSVYLSVTSAVRAEERLIREKYTDPTTFEPVDGGGICISKRELFD